MKKMITLKNILIFPILLGGIFITNCTSDQNVNGYTDSKTQSVYKVNTTEFASVELGQLEFEIEIQVSPNILNLQSSGVVVTIHTNIPYSDVYASSVSLNGIEIQSWKSDNRGFFVAKFNMDEVKALEELDIGGYNTLTLEGSSKDGIFSGFEDILVIDKTGK